MKISNKAKFSDGVTSRFNADLRNGIYHNAEIVMTLTNKHTMIITADRIPHGDLEKLAREEISRILEIEDNDQNN